MGLGSRRRRLCSPAHRGGEWVRRDCERASESRSRSLSSEGKRPKNSPSLRDDKRHGSGHEGPARRQSGFRRGRHRFSRDCSSPCGEETPI
ncbi:hypothetical protein U1Q18_019570 [Sarracenia purpurea var. burkii]